jgi:hypothetical protein
MRLGLGPLARSVHLHPPLGHFTPHPLDIGGLAGREVLIVGEFQKRPIDQQRRRMVGHSRKTRHQQQWSSHDENSENVHGIYLPDHRGLA